MIHETIIVNILSVAGTLLAAAVATRIFMTNLRRELPLFVSYCAYSVVQSVVLLTIRNYFGFRSIPHFLVYWALFIGETVLFFFVIHEVYQRALERYEGLRKLSAMIFRWAFMVMVLVATITTLTSSADPSDVFYGGVLLLDRAALIVELGLIVLLFVFCKSLSLGWKECIFGIAVGICLMCSIEVLSMTLRVHYGRPFADVYTILKPITWVITVGIWALYVFRSEHARSRVIVFRDAELAEWNDAVLRFLNR